MQGKITRRQALRSGAVAGAGVGAAMLADPFVMRALANKPACGRLDDIEHVVILIQENRSFDHYFGTYPGVRGFSDPNVLPLNDGSGLNIFAQPGYNVPGYGGHLYPFHFDSRKNGECTNDIDHQWASQHRSWNGGAMDHWVIEHIADNGVNGANTMGYYERSDLEFYYALADAFTLCDGYHCSVLGGTDANRLFSVSATNDPDGKNGGPHLDTLVSTRPEKFFAYTWPTMPELLSSAGISWKVYSDPDGNFGDNVLAYFKAYENPALAARAFAPAWPGQFGLDVATGQLPQVSWVIAPLLESEHPPAPVQWGENVTYHVLRTLARNPAVWEKTALFVTWDENGGFFDHVPPPVAPAGTPGEYLTVDPLPAEAAGIAGPIGLGIRVPTLVAGPLARGGFVCHDTFDHTSTLRFLEARFGVKVPNLSAWRRSVTGDLTSAFNFVRFDQTVPKLPRPSLLDSRVTTSTCVTSAPISEADESSSAVAIYPVPPNSMPSQEPGTRPAPSGPVGCKTPPPPPATRGGLLGGLLHALGR